MTRLQQIARKHEEELWEVTAEPSREQLRVMLEAALREAVEEAVSKCNALAPQRGTEIDAAKSIAFYEAGKAIRVHFNEEVEP